MSLQNFIPQVWAARLQRNLHRAHVYGNPLVINRDYEGEIKNFGDTVRINAIGPITVSDYTRNTDINSPETVQSAQTVLSIDQAKYFNFGVDDVDQAQIRPQVMDEAMLEAGYAVADVTDQFIAGKISGNVATANTIGSAGSPQTDLATDGAGYGYLVALAQHLDESSVPQVGRWVIVPPWFYAYIRKDSRFIHPTPAGDVLLRTGRVDSAYDMGAGMDNPNVTAETVVGQIAGFTVLMSNNVPNSSNTAYQIAAGHKIAWSFAEQVVKIEAYRPPYRFEDAVKGLHVYGAKVTRPNALALLYANPT
jgi:hypothetical protein